MLNVIDTGLGIAKENLPRIFDSIFQVENTNRGRYRGTGLGLSIVKQLVTQMNGSIQVESELNVGSKFSCNLVLPYAEEIPENN